MTVPAVTEELRSTDAGMRFDVEDVDIYAPAEDAVAEVEATVDELGEELSEADVAVVALALEREAVVVSDDYGVQNVASYLDVAFEGFLKDEIEDELAWTYRCTVCGEETESKGDCPHCGGDVTRVVSESSRRS